jgi:nucleoside-diphosphate-sugar epimerase
MDQPTTPRPAGGRHVILGAGPVGRAIAGHLADTHGVTPDVVTRSGTAVPGARPVTADITDGVTLRGLLAGADVVYQCAQPAYHRWPQEFPALQAAVVDAVAATGTLLVPVENMYGYGPVAGPLTEDLPLAATTRKGAVRAAMYRELVEAHRSGRIRMVVARAADFVGPGTQSAFGTRLVGQVLAGGKVDVLGDPDALHSVTSVADLAAAMVRLAGEPSAWGRAWHVPNAPAVTQRELVGMAAAAAGTSPSIRVVRRWQLRAIGTVVAPMREMVEMAYEFEHDFVVDHSAYADAFGAHATPLPDVWSATVAAESTGRAA